MTDDLSEVNPLISLTTADTIWQCQTLAACYELAQSVLSVGIHFEEWDSRSG